MWGGALLAAALLIITTVAIANALDTPVGLWKSIDEETNQPQSYVSINEASGVLSGKLEKLLDPAKKDATCDKCTDERKNQPVQGMAIIRNVKLIGKGVWGDGEILDPNNGRVYRVQLKLLDGGKTLEVRGYIGPFFRNQHWVRAE
jgi:uncharacterized protein (DUF2147 family)